MLALGSKKSLDSVSNASFLRYQKSGKGLLHNVTRECQYPSELSFDIQVPKYGTFPSKNVNKAITKDFHKNQM